MTRSQIRLCMKDLLFLLFVLVCLPITGFAQSAEQGKEEDPVMLRIEFKSVRLKTLLERLGKQLKINVIFDEEVKDPVTDVEFNNITVKAAMKAILAQQGLEARLKEEKTIVIFPSDNEATRQRYDQYKIWPDETDKKP